MPADTTEAIAALPSFSETFGDMLLAMRKQKSKNLIIDLRGKALSQTRCSYSFPQMTNGQKYCGLTFLSLTMT